MNKSSKPAPALRLAADVSGNNYGKTAITASTLLEAEWKPGVQVGFVIKATGLGKPVNA